MPLNEKILAVGVSECDYCGKLIDTKVVFRQGYTYLRKECLFEQKTLERLVGKGEYYKYQWEDVPRYWARIEIDTKQQGDTKLVIKNSGRVGVLIIMLTTRCNSRCRICKYITKRINIDPPRELDTEFIKSKIESFKGKLISFCMGEATVREDLPDLINIAARSGHLTSISTNGLKLADRGYVKKLKSAGLDYVYLSFDGFNERIYDKLRDGKYQYELKLKALDNLKKEKMKVALKTVLVKGVNEDQISQIINFAKENSFVKEISFQPLSLAGEQAKDEFNKDHLFSKEEIMEQISGVLGISKNIFRMWDEVKIGLTSFFAKYLYFLKIPVFQEGVIYFLKYDKKIHFLFEEEELLKIIKGINNKDLIKILGSLVRLGMRLLKSGGSCAPGKLWFFGTGDKLFKISVQNLWQPRFYNCAGDLVRAVSYSPGVIQEFVKE